MIANKLTGKDTIKSEPKLGLGQSAEGWSMVALAAWLIGTEPDPSSD